LEQCINLSPVSHMAGVSGWSMRLRYPISELLKLIIVGNSVPFLSHLFSGDICIKRCCVH
jgi:hypothetical protein